MELALVSLFLAISPIPCPFRFSVFISTPPSLPLQVTWLDVVRSAPVLQLHGAPPGGRVDTRHHASLTVELGLGLEAVQLNFGADGNS